MELFGSFGALVVVRSLMPDRTIISTMWAVIVCRTYYSVM